jgi:hypothetical protein
MPKISRDNGPTNAGAEPTPTPADVLRKSGKLGPYKEEETPVALQICAECSTACAADLTVCPNCGSTDLAEDGAEESAAEPAGDPEVAGEEQEAEGGEPDNEVEPDAQPVDAALPRPATNASKAEWLAYAEAVTGEDCADYTKAELIELVGKA